VARRRTLVGGHGGDADDLVGGAMNRRRLQVLVIAGGAVLACVLLLAGIAVVIAAATGVAATLPGAWVLRVTLLPGLAVRLNLPALARLATAPAVQRLLDGRSVGSRYGRLRFGRDGNALTVACAPCRIDDRRLASTPLRLDEARLALARVDAQTLRGELASGTVAIAFTAKLQRDRIDLDGRLPPTAIAAVYGLFGDAVPEAARAQIDGRIAARGSLRLPQRRASVTLEIEGFAVDGLDTGQLAAGPIAFSCRDGDGRPAPRRLMPSEGRWISATQSGALLASALIAAEDQRFFEHPGYDLAEISQLLAQIDTQGLARGASTLSQQLARTLFTGGERTAARKLRELLYAVEMERTLGKQAILALYLNSVDWGPGLCGADAAARAYFGKRPGQLSPLEAAWLASILPNPAQAHASEFLAGAADTARATRVLRQMRNLPRPQREHWAMQPLVFAAPDAVPRLAAR